MIKGKILQPDEIDFDWFLSFNDEVQHPEILSVTVDPFWQAVVDLLPPPLKETVSVLDGTEEVKMGLYCTIAIAGALMAGVKINYDGKFNFPGLMTMIYYPPASGKGKLALLPTVLNKINSELIAKNNKAIKKYNAEMNVYKKAIKKGSEADLPEKPSLSILQASGNITSAKLIEQLAENNGKEMLLLYETEMDSFGIMASNSEHGKMNSMILRKSFHNEQVSQMRRNNAEHLVVNQPKVATVLIGTASQIRRVIPNNEDGLLSRFLIVKGNAPVEWKNVQPCYSCVSLDDHYENLSHTYYELWKYLSDKSIEVQFTNEQWNWINQFGESRLFDINPKDIEYASSIAKRHANMVVRIAAISCMVRYFNREDVSQTAICGDEDFTIAKKMVEESYKSSLELFNELAKSKSGIANIDSKQEFYNDLPASFKVKDIIIIADKHSISGRTLFRRLEQFEVEGLLHSPKRGEYVKLPKLPSINSQELTNETTMQNG